MGFNEPEKPTKGGKRAKHSKRADKARFKAKRDKVTVDSYAQVQSCNTTAAEVEETSVTEVMHVGKPMPVLNKTEEVLPPVSEIWLEPVSESPIKVNVVKQEG